jgi:hypothetical protein
MRSSPSFSVASRRGAEGEPPQADDPKGSKLKRLTLPRQTDDHNELTINLKVGYKTVLLIVVVFDLVHTSIRELVNSEMIMNLLGN